MDEERLVKELQKKGNEKLLHIFQKEMDKRAIFLDKLMTAGYSKEETMKIIRLLVEANEEGGN